MVYNYTNGTNGIFNPFNRYDGANVEQTSELKKIITMRAYKYDGRLHYEQPLELFEKTSNHIVLKGRKGRELIHYTRDTVFKFDSPTLEYFFTDRWYTAALVFDDDGNVMHVYCNIALPCKIEEDAVEFIDLDVDVVVIDGKIEVVDIDEFEEHKELYQYGGDLEKRVFETVDTVIRDITEGNYPFNRSILDR